MNFEINNIVENHVLTIRLLTYGETPATEFDLKLFSPAEREKFEGFYSLKRKREFYYTRLLWKTFERNETIFYTPTGKPILKKGYISISHSKNKIAIGYSTEFSIGLDIEHFNPKIFRIRPKFTSRYETENFNLDDQYILTTIWSIKEAIYKLVDIPGLRFKEDICVLEIAESNRVEVELRISKNHYHFERITFDAFILTYCISDRLKIIS